MELSSPEQNEATNAQHVVVIGNGHLGQALAQYISRTAACTPRYTFSHTHRRCKSSSIADAVAKADIVLLAVPSRAYKKLFTDIRPLIRPNAIVIDAANAPLSYFFSSGRDQQPSTAAILSKMLPPGVAVVKGFNTISANYVTELNQKQVPLPTGITLPFALDHNDQALQRMNEFISALYFAPHYMGDLHPYAKQLESIPHVFFPSYKSAVIISTIVWIWWMFYFVLSVYILYGGGKDRPWDRFFLSSFLATTGETSTTLFSITFLSGPLAIIYKRFKRDLPEWMKWWLNKRKQLGLVAFVFATAHAFAGGLSSSNLDMSWTGQFYSVPGVISFVLFGLLVLCSTVYASSLSWAEFRAIFSYLGTAALALAVLHQGFWGFVLTGYPSSAEKQKFWVDDGSPMAIHWLGIILPLLVLVLRFISWMPCFWESTAPPNDPNDLNDLRTEQEEV